MNWWINAKFLTSASNYQEKENAGETEKGDAYNLILAKVEPNKMGSLTPHEKKLLAWLTDS